MDLEKLPDVFVDERKAAKEKKAQEQKIDRLFSQVGKLTIQLEWLFKKRVASDPDEE